MKSLMENALGDQWTHLPAALQAHYQAAPNSDSGLLSVEFPLWMKLPLSLLRVMGVLFNRRVSDVPTTVEKHFDGEIQYWHRRLSIANKPVTFDSRWQYVGNGELIEFVNRYLGLRMKVGLEGEVLIYSGVCFVFQLFGLQLRLPEWLLLGHTEIQEKAIDGQSFAMDFRLIHPLFGQIYRFSGVFSTTGRQPPDSG